VTELYTPQADWFEQERPAQPKKVVGDYVETEGILVPHRFADFEEAQFAAQNVTAVIARSEHPDEYSGPSGLGYTSQFIPNEDGVMLPRHHMRKRDVTGLYEHYAHTWGGQSPDSYVADASESYWQAIPGINITCVADDTVKGRYHVFGHRYKKLDGSMPSMVVGAIVEENGDIAFTIRHPAVTSAIIGPRTMEQLESQLDALSVELNDKLLDKIDEIVPPGTNANQYETSWDSPALHPANLRR
jgi:hypothetical protein